MENGGRPVGREVKGPAAGDQRRDTANRQVQVRAKSGDGEPRMTLREAYDIAVGLYGGALKELAKY